MNKRTRDIVYRFLVQRDGEFCKNCHVSGTEKELVVEHIDNDNSDNDPNNLQLLCRSCNYKKNPRLAEREPLDMCECELRKHTTYEYTTDEIRINKEKEPLFREYVDNTIEEKVEFEKEDLINSGAETIGIATITADRYLKKLCSSAGNYKIIRKNNANYVVKR